MKRADIVTPRMGGLHVIGPPADESDIREMKRQARLARDPRYGTRCWNCNVSWPDHSPTCAGRT